MNKKKLFLIVLLCLLLLPFVVNAKECDNTKITILSMKEKSVEGNIVEVQEPTFSGRDINLNLRMHEVKDSITYDMIIKNDTNENYMIDEDTFKTDSKYIVYTLGTNDGNNVVKAKSSKSITLKVEYKKEVDKSLFYNNKFNASNNLSLTLNTSKKEQKLDFITTDNLEKFINPLTDNQSILVICFILFVLALLIYLTIHNKRKYNNYLIIILTVALIPTVYAACKCDIKVKATIEIDKNEKYKEALLNGADPVYSDNLIPIIISNDGKVTKADIYSKWYSYGEKQWANSVILKEAKTYKVGEEIPIDNIESFFVWIPKYSYKLWDLGNYNEFISDESLYEEKNHPIDIKFGLDNTVDSSTECSTPLVSGASGQCDVGKYMTHPAFISMNSNGIWVGKFETGYLDALTSQDAEIDVEDASKIIIKPDTYAWHNISITNSYNNAFNYLRSADSHLLKNTEWGAVAYLSNSKYGSCTGTTCSKIRINNNSDFKTGYGSKIEPTCGWTSDDFMSCRAFGNDNQYNEKWTEDSGLLASTTLNVSGIYDMSGGAWEYVSAFTLDSTNTQPFFNAISFSSRKYYDAYNYMEISNQFNNRILGDAMGENGPFFIKHYLNINNNDYIRYISSWNNMFASFYSSKNYYFIIRGGDYISGSDSGIFAFYTRKDLKTHFWGYRIALLY